MYPNQKIANLRSRVLENSQAQKCFFYGKFFAWDQTTSLLKVVLKQNSC